MVITGLPRPSSSTSHADKKKHYSDVITRLISLACASADVLPTVLDVYINLRKDQGLPVVEARLDSVSGSQLFRREGVRLAKEQHAEFSTLFLSNSVTQSTRVRIEILKALSKKLSTPSETAYVQGFISRPLLQFRAVEGCQSNADGVGRSYNFVDAMVKFGSMLSAPDLTLAYTRAGTTFVGAMSQYFIVLEEGLVTSGSFSRVNRAPLGRRGGRVASRRSRGASSRVSTASVTEITPSSPVPTASVTETTSDAPDRGTKRPGEPTHGPSKRNENTLKTVTE